MVDLLQTSGDADREAESSDDDNDQVLEDEQGLAEAAVVVPEGEQLDHGGEGQTHGGQAESADQRDEELEVGDGYREHDCNRARKSEKSRGKRILNRCIKNSVSSLLILMTLCG